MRSRLRIAHVQLPMWWPGEGERRLESTSHGTTLDTSYLWMMRDGMSDDEQAAVFAAAVVLYQTVGGDVTFGECLDTALTWDRG